MSSFSFQLHVRKYRMSHVFTGPFWRVSLNAGFHHFFPTTRRLPCLQLLNCTIICSSLPLVIVHLAPCALSKSTTS